MRKLDDIPKKSVFKVPDGYFDQLPLKILERISEESRTTSRAMVFSWKFALPVIALIVAGIFWFRPQPSLEEQFDDIDTGQISLYLETAEQIETEETYESMDWTTPELDELEDAVYSTIEFNEDDIDLEEL